MDRAGSYHVSTDFLLPNDGSSVRVVHGNKSAARPSCHLPCIICARTLMVGTQLFWLADR